MNQENLDALLSAANIQQQEAERILKSLAETNHTARRWLLTDRHLLTKLVHQASRNIDALLALLPEGTEIPLDVRAWMTDYFERYHAKPQAVRYAPPSDIGCSGIDIGDSDGI